ncbi:hypothetical protein B0H14DRAFT_3132398 [Mycena olivaceomarginata]|nr:hypothetical protein B0H14DRAFT_3132398 [Mycena olivaceomarginata]
MDRPRLPVELLCQVLYLLDATDLITCGTWQQNPSPWYRPSPTQSAAVPPMGGRSAPVPPVGGRLPQPQYWTPQAPLPYQYQSPLPKPLFVAVNPFEARRWRYGSPARPAQPQPESTVNAPLIPHSVLSQAAARSRPAYPTVEELDARYIQLDFPRGKRVVVFLDANADGPESVPFILPEFQMIWETPFSQTDDKFPCSIDRINGPLAYVDHMYMINHSLNKNIIPFIGDGVLVSDPIDAPRINGADSINAHVAGCAPLGANRNPSCVLIDYVNLGDALTAVKKLNGL